MGLTGDSSITVLLRPIGSAEHFPPNKWRSDDETKAATIEAVGSYNILVSFQVSKTVSAASGGGAAGRFHERRVAC